VKAVERRRDEAATCTLGYAQVTVTAKACHVGNVYVGICPDYRNAMPNEPTLEETLEEL